MGKPCSHLFSKVYLIVFNLIFLLSGAGTLGLGIWMSIDRDTFMVLQLAQGSTSLPMFDRTPYILMGVGAAMMLVCFMGCCGACAESVCFLSFYSVILFVLILSDIVLVVLAVVKKDDLEADFSTKMLEQVRISYNRSQIRDVNKTDLLTYVWDAMQVELECCGARSPKDYMFSTWWNHTKNSAGMAVPHTCCVLFNDNPEVPMVRDNRVCQIEGFVFNNEGPHNKSPEPWLELHTQGCVNAVLEWIETHSDKFISTCVTLIVLRVLGLFCSCFLVVSLRREHGKDWTDEDLREDK